MYGKNIDFIDESTLNIELEKNNRVTSHGLQRDLPGGAMCNRLSRAFETLGRFRIQ